MSSTNARAVRLIAHPGELKGVENPKPGSDGAITWNAGPSAGSTRLPTIPANSANELG